MPELLAGYSVVVGQLRLGIMGVLELEALASGRPLIMHFDAKTYAEESYYREMPPITTVADPRATAEAIIHLTAETSDAPRIAARSRTWATQYHSAATVAMLYRDAYEQRVLGRGVVA